MNNRLAPTDPQLPANPVTVVERIGYKLLAALDRLGFVHQNLDGTVFTIHFSEAVLFADEVAAFSVDVERLYHFSVSDLSRPKVVQQLAAVVRLPVKAHSINGLTYLVRLKPPRAKPRLPSKIMLDLGNCPTGNLLVPIGEGRYGAVWRELPGVGHCLIVGATGAGKSNWLHCALAALLTTTSPDLLQVVLLDPKRSELTPWATASHVLGDVAHTVDQAARALGDVVNEIDRRGDLLGAAGMRDLAAYNRKAADSLPWVLVVIDECLDLTLQAGERGDLSNLIKVIATRGRSAGVILWAATQHATAISGLPRVVNVNLASRLCFRVQDAAAAHVAGCPGAHTIPRDKPGRMLAKLDSDPIELQGYYLADDTLQAIALDLGTRPAGPTLNSQERALMAWALAENNGYLSLADMETVGGLGQMGAKRLAAQWERKRWLEKDTQNKNKRRLTQAALELVQGWV